MDKIDRLKIFCCVAERYSFAQVAKELDLPRSTVTYAIRSLEKEYEVLLFNRTTRKVNLTNDGALFFEQAQQLIIQSEQLNKFKVKKRGNMGQIKIGLPIRLATQFLIPYLNDFYQQYPNVRISIHSSDHYSDLIDQRLDCVIRVGQVYDESLIIRPILEVDLYTVISQEYQSSVGNPLNINSLENHYLVGYQPKNIGLKIGYLDFKNKQIKLPYQLSVEDTESYLQAGLHGLGMIQIPAFDAEPFIQTKQLIQVLEHEECLKIPINFLFLERKYRPEYFQSFIDWFQNLLKNKLSVSYDF